ncbi:MAG: serine/threonine-protein kinase [Polyangiales bacterium]
MLLAAGTMLEGKYRIERLLGAGGMGSVWIAEHTMLGRPVAVKVLDKAAAAKDATAVTRFMREAQTAARLRSDHIVDVLDVGRFDDGTPFLVMELLEGETLSSRIKRSVRMIAPEAGYLVDQLLDALGAAHNAGVIHRDIKPDNCFILQKSGRDHLKLLDFGISKVAGDAREMRMTRTGVVMGTPYYMAPEQARGSKEIDHRCDLYAAGAILYECVTGRVPFEAESVNELLFKIVLEPLVLPREIVPELDPAFEQVILTAMAREAVNRFPTAQAFRDALAPFLSGLRMPSGSSIARVVVTTPPPRSSPPSNKPISGIEATAPIDSDAMQRVLAQTPSGLQGLSATGGVHVSEPPRPRRAGVLVVAGVASLALLGGVGYLASHRAEPTTGTTAAAQPTTPPTPQQQTEKTMEKKATVVEPVKTAMLPPEPPATAVPAKTATKPGKKDPAPPPQKSAAPIATSVAAPPPPPPPPAKGTSPRPIDTAL